LTASFETEAIHVHQGLHGELYCQRGGTNQLDGFLGRNSMTETGLYSISPHEYRRRKGDIG
jgi:hypothetical protein